MRVFTSTWRSGAVAVVIAGLATPLAAGSPATAAGRLCGPQADTVPPQVSDLQLSTDAVDVTDGDATITVTAHISDTSGSGDPSGVKRAEVEVRGPRFYTGTKLALASGDATDGDWQGTLTIQKGAPAGDWTVEAIGTEDNDRNFHSYYQRGSHAFSPDDISLQSGWDTGFTVTDNGIQPPPTRKPAGKLTDFTMKPRVVDTTEGAKRVHVTATFSKPQPREVRVEIEGRAPHGRYFHEVRLKQGTDNTWRRSLEVGQWAGRVKAQVYLFGEWDRTTTKPAYRRYDSTKLAGLDFPSQLTIKGLSDETKPTLTGLTITPTSVDTTSGPQTVDITATASDTQSGVSSVYVRVFHAGRAGGYAFARLQPDGDNWTGQLKLRACSASGIWKVGASVEDNANNYTNYRQKKLAAAGMTSSIEVTSNPGDNQSPEVIGATASGRHHTITLNFSEGVKTVTDSTLSVYAMKPAADRYKSTTPVSSISCSDGTNDVACSGDDGLVTSAVLDVPGVVSGAKFRIWSNVDAVTPQLTDGAGNPLDWDYPVAEVKGS
jgi:hypothetical protein